MRRSQTMLSSSALLGAALSACAAQMGPGWTTHGGAAPSTLSIEGRTFVPRKSGPLLGASVNAAFGDRAAPLRVRSGMVSAGYHARTADRFPLGFGGEAALDLGLGQPTLRDLGGTGGYVGASGTLLVRLGGPGDDEPRFDILSTLVDLAMTSRVGVWTNPEGSPQPVTGELGGLLALRLTFTSDLGSSSEPGRK